MRDHVFGDFSANDRVIELEKRQTGNYGEVATSQKKRCAALLLRAREFDPYFLGQPLPDLSRQAVMNSSRT